MSPTGEFGEKIAEEGNLANHLSPGAHASRLLPSSSQISEKKKKNKTINSVPKQLMNNARVSEEASINSIPVSHAEQVEEIKLRAMDSPLLLRRDQARRQP